MAMSYLDYRIKHRKHQKDAGQEKPSAAPSAGSAAGPSASETKAAGKKSSAAGSSFLDFKVNKRNEQIKNGNIQTPQTYSPAPRPASSPVYSSDGAFFPKKNPYEGITTRRPNPLENVPYSDPLTRAFSQQTGWRDPKSQALYDLAERMQNPQQKITPASVFRSGPLADAVRGPRSRSVEAEYTAPQYKSDPEAGKYIEQSIRSTQNPFVKHISSHIDPADGSVVFDGPTGGRDNWMNEYNVQQNLGSDEFRNSQREINSRIAAGQDYGRTDYEMSVFNNMTADEQKEYSYRLGKYGRNEADRYLQMVGERVSNRRAAEIVEGVNRDIIPEANGVPTSYIDPDTGETVTLGKSPINAAGRVLKRGKLAAQSGLDMFRTGVGDRFTNYVTGRDRITPASPEARASQQVKEDLAGPGRVAYDVVENAAMMLPTTAAAVAASIAMPQAAPAIMQAGTSNSLAAAAAARIAADAPQIFSVGATMFPMSAGQAYEEALQKGLSQNQARLFATAEGLNQAAGEYLLGGFEDISGGFAKQAVDRVLGDVASDATKSATQQTVARAIQHFLTTPEGRMAFSMGSEAFEEIVQGSVSNALGNVAFGENNAPISQEDLYSGLVASLSAGLSNARYYATGYANGAGRVYSAEDIRAAANNIITDRAAYQNQAAYDAAMEQRDQMLRQADYVEQGGKLTPLEKSELADAAGGELGEMDRIGRQVKTGRDMQDISDAINTAREIAQTDETKARVDEVSVRAADIAKRRAEGKQVTDAEVGRLVNDTIRATMAAGNERAAAAAEARSRIGFGEQGASVIESSKASGQKLEAMTAAYEEARYNIPRNEAQKQLASSLLSEQEFSAAYQAGIQDRNAFYNNDYSEKIAKIAEKYRPGNIKHGNVTYDGVDIKTLETAGDKDSRTKYAQMKTIEHFLSGTLGYNVEWFESKTEDGRYTGENGSYTRSKHLIRLDVNAGADVIGDKVKFASVISHELTHTIEDGSPMQYQKLADSVMKMLVADQEYSQGRNAEQIVADMIENNPYVSSEADAIHELVAQACEDMMSGNRDVRAMFEGMSEAEQKTIFDHIKSIFAAIKNFFDEMLNSESVRSNRTEAAAIRRAKENIEALQKEWTEGVKQAAAYNAAAYEESRRQTAEQTEQNEQMENVFGDDTGRLTKDADGNVVIAESKDGSKIAYSIKTLPTTQEKLAAVLKRKGYSEESIKAAQDQVQTVADMLTRVSTYYAEMAEALDAELLVDPKTGKTVLHSFVTNGDYPVNIDFLTICKKREAYMHVMTDLIEHGIFDKVAFNGAAIATTNEILRDSGFETACACCFVESRRLQIQRWAETFCSEWNEEVLKRNPNATPFNFSKGERGANDLTQDELIELENELRSVTRKEKNPKGNIKLPNKGARANMGPLLDRIPALAHTLSVGDLITPNGIDSLRATDGNLFSLVKQRYGTATPKITQSFSPYNGDVADLNYGFMRTEIHESIPGSKKYKADARKELAREGIKKPTAQQVEDRALRKYLYDIGGVRLQSFSDFLVENTLDYFQMFADLAAKELPLHAYSKEISFIKMFGMTGGKMNMSLIPVVDLATDKEHAGLKKNKDGTYSYAGWGDYEHHLMIDNRSFIQSIGFKDAIALQLHPGYSSHIGTIAIGISNAHIRKMLNDPLIRMVIPYHSSGMLPEFAKQMHIDYYHDYTTTQNTTLGRCTDMSGNEVETYNLKGNDSYKCDTHYDFNEAFQRLGDAREACEEYKAWCKERHPVYKGSTQVGWAEFTPKFAEFANERNYYKLIEDFNSYDCITEKAAVQGAVTMSFPGMEQNLLNDEELKAYEERLRATGQFNEKEIKKYVSRANETLEDIVTREAKNRNAYHREMDKKYDSTLNKIEAALQRDYNKADYDLVNNKYVRRDGTQMSARFSDASRTSENGTFLKANDAAKNITAALSESGYRYNYYGIRSTDYKANVGDILPASHDLADDSEGEELSGVSATGFGQLWYDEDDLSEVEKALKSHNKTGYEGEYHYLIGGNESEYGNDPSEVLIKDAEVVGIIDRDGNVFTGNNGEQMSARVDGYDESSPSITADTGVQHSHRVTEKATLDRLNAEVEAGDYITTYKAMQLIDGKLYPPMAAKVKGSDGKYRMQNASELGVWQQADEDPAHIKIRNGKGYYTLNKGNGKSIDAAYNPYEHSSNLVLNDQFEEAYKRDNLVFVECRIPKSEIDNPYRAEYAKDATGVLDWKAGTVAGKLKNNRRQVYLSRYLMPYRILGMDEVAAMWKDALGDSGIEVPFNVVPSALLNELEKAGVPIDKEGSPIYRAHNKTQMSARDSSGKTLTAQQADYFKNSKIRDADGNLQVMYHGTERGGFTVFDPAESDDGISLFFTDYSENAREYSGSYDEITPDRRMSESELFDMIENITEGDFQLSRTADGYAIEEYTLDNEGNFTYKPKKSFKTLKEAQAYAYEEFVKEGRKGGYGTIPGNYAVYLNLQNPLVVDAQDSSWREIPYWENDDGELEPATTREIAEDAKEQGYDGVIINNVWDNGQYAERQGVEANIAIAFSSNQVKSVYNENPTENNDIRYSSRMQELDAEYQEALDARNEDWQLMLVDQAAYNAGYTVGAYHGSPFENIRTFNTRSQDTKKQAKQLLFGTHFTHNLEYAKIYARKAKNSKGTSRMTTKTGQIYKTYLDLGKSLDLRTARNITPGTEEYKLYEDAPAKYQKKFKPHTFSKYDTEQGLGSGQYITASTIEDVLQAMSPKEATDFLVDHGYNSILYDADYSTPTSGRSRLTRDPSIIMLDPERIKSGDPVTYDDDGNVIPLSERFNPTSNDIRYSSRLRGNMDKQYDVALRGNDIDAAAKLVKKAAADAGYTVEGYHGTKTFGFTTVDLGESNMAHAFYVTDSLKAAEAYSDENDVREITNKKPSPAKQRKLHKKAQNTLSALVTKINKSVGRKWLDPDSVTKELDEIIRSNANDDDLLSVVGFYEKRMRQDYYDEIGLDPSKYYSPNPFEVGNEYLEYQKQFNREEIYQFEEDLNHAFMQYSEYALSLNENNISGNYHFFINPEGLLEVDGKGAHWNQLDFRTDEDGARLFGTDRMHFTDEIASYALYKGYPGVVFRNIYDGGDAPSDVYALFSPWNRVKSADAVTYDDSGNVIPLSERFNAANEDIRYSTRNTTPAPAFYSKLQREIEGFKGNKIGAASVESYLKGKGVKDEEIKWSGIRTFLEGKKSVDKAELLQYLRENELQIEQTVTGGDSGYVDESTGKKFASAKAILDYVENELGYKNYSEDYDDYMGRFSVWIDNGTDDGIELNFEKTDADTNWGEYRLNGGDNYREILFRIPNSNYSNDAMQTHWGESGVLAHARVQDFETDDGDKVLFVEEIQSDWHNAGQKAGYSPDLIDSKGADILNEITTSNEFDAIAKQIAQNKFGDTSVKSVSQAKKRISDLFRQYAEADSSVLESKIAEEAGVKRLIKDQSDIVMEYNSYLMDAIGTDYAVPDAPYRTTYTDFVLKNLLRMAAEGDYDYLAWTTGKMQEERWSDQYAEGYRIEYDQQIPKFLKKYGKQWGANLKEISIYTSDNADNASQNTDRKIREFVEVIKAYDKNATYESVRNEMPGLTGYAVSWIDPDDPNWDRITGLAKEIDEADFWRANSTESVPAIAVNELMKQSVLTEGQPRFSARDNGFGRNASFGTVEELERRNENIREMNYGLDAVLQNRGTQTRKLSDQQIERIARRFLWEYGSKADVETITNGLKSMYEYIDNQAKISAQQVGKIANSFAEQILDESKEVDDNMARMYPELARDIKGTKLYVSPETMKEMAYYFENAADFRRQAKKFVTISEQRDGARGIDTFYEELSGNFPELFDSEIVNEKDQLLQIMDVAEQLKKKTVNKDWGSEYDEIAYTLGQDMIAAYFAEKGDGSHKRNIDMIKAQMKAEHQEYVDGLRRAKERQIKEIKDKLTGERRQNIAKIAELRAKLNAQFRERQDKAELRRLTTQAKARLQKNARNLWSKRGTPEFERLKAKLFSELDLVSVGISKAGVLNLEKTYNDAVRQAALDPDFASSDEYKNIELKFRGGKDVPSIERKKLRDLSYEEIVSLTEDILALKHSQQTYNRMMKDNFKATVAEYGRKGVAQQNIVTGILNQNGFRANALATAKRYALYMENPVRAAHLLDGYQEDGVLTELFDDINNGTTKKTRFQQKTHEMFEEVLNDKELMDGWSDQNIEIEVRGQKYHISKGMRIAIALHAQNTDNIRHIENGGFNIPNERYYKQGRYTDAYNSGTRVWMSKEDMDRIAAGMTEGEKRFAQIAHNFFNKSAKDAINETSLILKGYELAVVPNYFPIRTDKNFTQAEIDGLIHDGTIEGKGQFKDRQPGAKNPILLEDVALVIDRQTQTTGAYYGIAIPVRDMNKVWNYTATAYAASMKDSIARNWGELGKQTIEKTLTDIQAGARRGDTGDHIFSFLKGAYAASTLVGNIGVSIKQAASYPLAISMIDADCLAKGLTMKTDRAYMDSITPWSWDRRHGMGGEEMSDILKQKGMIARNQTAQSVKNFFNLIQKVDVLTTDHLFSACEAQIQKNHPKLEVRGDEYNKKVAELYNEMLWRTQPSYGVMQRNELMRSSSSLMKALTMFKTQTFNMGGEILDAALRAQAMNDYAKNGLVSKAEAKRAAKALGRVMWATVLSQATLAAMTALANAVLRKMRPYRDDKGEVTGASVARKIGTDFVTSWFGLFFGADLAEQGIAAVLNFAQWYDITAPQFDRLNDTVSDLSAWTRALIDRATETDEGKKAERNAKVVKTTAKVAISATGAIGIPAQNIYNMLNAVNLLLQDTSKDGSGFLSFEAGSGLLGLTDTAPTKEQYARQAVYYSERDDTEKVAHALEGTNKSTLEKVLGSKLSKNLYESFLDDPENLAKYMNVKRGGSTPKITDVPDDGYESFTKLREAIGDPERTQNWHHIVEQEQGSGKDNFGNFSATQINNKNNIVSVPSGAKSPHTAISKYYDSVQDFTDGKTVREWLSTKSFEEQFDFGVKQLQKYGDIIPTSNGWVFVPDDAKIEAALPLETGKPDERTETQKQWATKMAELREDGGLSGREVREAALSMLQNGLTAEEALELYKQNQKSDKTVGKWKGSFEDYLKGRNAVDEAKAIKDSDKKRQSERRKDSIESYLRQYRGSREDELLLWKLMGYSENTFEFK